VNEKIDPCLGSLANVNAIKTRAAYLRSNTLHGSFVSQR